METIDEKWLTKKLGTDRGKRARLAEHLGLSPDKVSKMISGKRQPQANEIPKILEFFNEAPIPEELQDIWSELSEAERQTLIDVAKSMHARLAK